MKTIMKTTQFTEDGRIMEGTDGNTYAVLFYCGELSVFKVIAMDDVYVILEQEETR